MPAEEPDESSDDQGGVFGKLPASRPGRRSPRRDRGAGKRTVREDQAPAPEEAEPAGPMAAATAPSAEGTPAAEPPPPLDPATEASEGEEPPALEGDRAGLEDLAWAGIAAAAEAATLGVRLAGRAMGAVRDSVDRR